MYIQTYANKELILVIVKTPKSATFLKSGLATAAIETPEITRKLNAADPTIVDGPNRPGSFPKVVTVSMIDKSISGALEPNAMRVKFAIVGFQKVIYFVTSSPS